MNKRGPHPTPTNILKLHNSRRGNDRKNEPEVDILNRLPAPPRHLNPTGKKFYKQIGNATLNMRVLSDADMPKLILICEVYEQYKTACRLVRNHSILIKSGTKFVRNPAVGARNESLRILNSMMGEYGLSPSARTKLTADVVKIQTEAELFNNLSQRGRKRNAG